MPATSRPTSARSNKLIGNLSRLIVALLFQFLQFSSVKTGIESEICARNCLFRSLSVRQTHTLYDEFQYVHAELRINEASGDNSPGRGRRHCAHTSGRPWPRFP